VNGQQRDDGKQQHEAHLSTQDMAYLLVVGFEGMQGQLVLWWPIPPRRYRAKITHASPK